MNHRNLRRLDAALVLALATCGLHSVAGEVQYRWENEKGEAVYSDRPPTTGVEYEVIDTHPGLNYAEPETPETEPSKEQPAADSTGATGDKPGDEGGKNAGLCKKARMNLIALEHQRGLSVRNETGQSKALSPEDVEFALANARQQIELYCD